MEGKEFAQYIFTVRHESAQLRDVQSPLPAAGLGYLGAAPPGVPGAGPQSQGQEGRQDSGVAGGARGGGDRGQLGELSGGH